MARAAAGGPSRLCGRVGRAPRRRRAAARAHPPPLSASLERGDPHRPSGTTARGCAGRRHAGTCTVSTLLATNRSRSLRAARFRNRLELALQRDHPALHALVLRDHPRAFRQPWVADVRHTGSGRPALRYLARYVFRSALGPGRLPGRTADGRIRLLCHDSGSNRRHVIALPVDTFLSRWLTHVLPKGFVRVRHYGWMSGAARKVRLRVRALACGELDEPPPDLPDLPAPRCPRCGAEMKLLAAVQPRAPP